MRPERAGWTGWEGSSKSPEFYPYLTGAENLRLLGGLDDPDTSDIAEKALSLVGLDDVERRKVSRYSLGMRQRLGIAAAVLRRPRLLILDEPTNGLDPVGTKEVLEALRALADIGVSVIFSTHVLPHVAGVCDSITILERGTVRFDGNLEQMKAEAPSRSCLAPSHEQRSRSTRPCGGRRGRRMDRGPGRDRHGRATRGD